MIFKGLVIAHEDSSYTGKRGRVEQETLTCLDADEVKLRDTVDCVFTAGAIPEASKLVGKTLEFQVDAIRPNSTMRPRFVVKGLVAARKAA